MGDRVLFEVIAEGKIAQHFKKRMMPRGIADIVEIIMFATRPNAFLARYSARNGAAFKARKHVLKGHHARIDEHQCRVVIRH